MKKMFLYVAVCLLLGAAFLMVYFAGEDLLTGPVENISFITFQQGEESVQAPEESLPGLKETLLAYTKKARLRAAADYDLPKELSCTFQVHYLDGSADRFGYSENRKLLFRFTNQSSKKIMLVYDPGFSLLEKLESFLPESSADEFPSVP